MGLIEKKNVIDTVIKLHQSGKKYPNEYDKLRVCRTQEEVQEVYKQLVLQVSQSVWDYFSTRKVTPNAETWERATYIAMGLKGDIGAELMINALKEASAESTCNTSVDEVFSPLSTEDKLINRMLWSFTRKWMAEHREFGKYTPSISAINNEFVRLGMHPEYNTLKRKLIEAGLMERMYNKDHKITERLIVNGEAKDVPVRVISVCNGTPILFQFMPQELIDSLDDSQMKEVWLRLA